MHVATDGYVAFDSLYQKGKSYENSRETGTHFAYKLFVRCK